MVAKMKGDKQEMVVSILDLLEIPDEKRVEMSENLNKMTKAALGLLDFYIMEIVGEEPEEVDRKVIPAGPKVALNLMPQDIGIANSAADVTEQLTILPVIGKRLESAWINGNFPLMKRNLRISEQITDNCRKMIAQQLYDSLKIEAESNDY